MIPETINLPTNFAGVISGDSVKTAAYLKSLIEQLKKAYEETASAVNQGMAYIEPQTSAFNEILTAELTPVFQNDFSYNINPELWEYKLNGGTATIDSNRLKMSTGAAANQSAILESKVPIKYHSGQGACVRFAALFTTGVAGSEQYVGFGDGADGFGFKYSGATFGVCRRHGGSPEIRTLTITTASTTAENITVTLDGDAIATIAVTASGVISTTANEIAAGDYSGVGTGWKATAVGDTVVFTSYESAVKTGTYSIAGTTVVGTFAQTVAGVAFTDEFVAQAAWNSDKANGVKTLPTIDWTKGNVFQIRYQWLGFGMISYWVENPDTGKLVCVHKIKYANANTTPSINNPTLPMCIAAANTTNTTDMVVYCSSVGSFTEGKVGGERLHHGISVTTAGITTEAPVLTIRNKEVYQGKLNRSMVGLEFASLATEGTKTVRARFYLNQVLTGTSFSDISANSSTVEYDNAATASTGGSEQLAIGLAKSDSEVIALTGTKFSLRPGDTLTVTAQSSSSTDVTASFNWEEGL